VLQRGVVCVAIGGAPRSAECIALIMCGSSVCYSVWCSVVAALSAQQFALVKMFNRPCGV